MNNLLKMFLQFRQNPTAMLGQRFNFPQNMTNPNDIIQHLLNTNQVSQDQLNRVMQMRNNPMVQQLLQGRM